MSNYEKANELRRHFDEAFPNGMSIRQMWFLVKYAKTVRKYARSNAAFNNLANMTFEGIARFKEIGKKDKKGKIYNGLEITIADFGGAVVTESDSSDEGGE